MRRVALVAVLMAALIVAATPGHSATKKYDRGYTAPSTPGLSFKFNPGEANVADEVDAAEEGTPLEGTNPLTGTPLDTEPLAGTPVDTGFGGVTFAKGSFQGTPKFLKVTDLTETPVSWAACQLNGDVPICGANSSDIQLIGCGNATAQGTSLAGFQKGNSIGVWIIVNDSGGVGGTPCDGVATSGTVTLVTET